MDLEITGRVAIVTGGSAGIGLAISQELLEAGCNVAIVARDPVRLATAEQSLRSPGRVLAMVADVARPETPSLVVERVISAFGQVDILVNNAGRAQAGDLMTSREEDWAAMTALKLSAMRRFCKAVVPGMQARKWGRIVNMSSIGGLHPTPKLLISHVLSAAICNFTRALALEVAGVGILVNAIGVGAVATDNWAKNMLPSVRQARPELGSLDDQALLAIIAAERTPVGRAGTPREIAAIAAFLTSGRNGFVTGGTIEASGGADCFI